MSFQIDENLMAPNRAIITRNKIYDDLLSVNPIRNKPGMMHYISKDKRLWLSVDPHKVVENSLEKTKNLYEVITDKRLKEEFEIMASKSYVAQKIEEYLSEVPPDLDLSIYATYNDLSLKVDKVAGKNLSTNDFTNELKIKLEGLYNYQLPSSLDPSIISQSNNYLFVTNNEKNVWNNKANSAHAHTKNQITDFPALSIVATSGSYNDLMNKPKLATVSSTGNYSDLIGKPVLSTVAVSGNYNDLINKPTIENTGITLDYLMTQLSKKANVSHAHDEYLPLSYAPSWNSITGKPAVFSPSSHSHDDKVDKVSGKSLVSDTEITRLANVTNYTHPLTHAASMISEDSTHKFVTDSQIATWNSKASSYHTHSKNQITDFPTSLPASGGDSDTVDGKHASDFSLSDHSHGNYSLSGHNHNSTYLGITSQAVDSNKIKGLNIFVQQSQPTAQSTGDIWISW